MLRPTKDKYFMDIAEICSTRSLDPDTKVGCVIVSLNGNIVSTGYNGPPRGVDDSKIPLTRPDKYTFMVHAELNCICNAARHGTPLEDCIAYVTRWTCGPCMLTLYQAGISEIVMLDIKHNGYSNSDQKIFDLLKNYMKVRIIKE